MASPEMRNARELNVLESARMKVAVGLATFGLAVGGANALAADNSEAERSDLQGPLTERTDGTIVEQDSSVITTIQSAKSKASSESAAKLKVIANYRTVSKAKIKKAEKAGNCEHFSPQEAIDAGIMTQGYQGSGYGYAPENRSTTLCDTNGDGKYDVRAECGNAAHETNKPKEEKAESTLWVKSFNKLKLKISAKAEAEATAECDTGGASAYAHGYGEALATTKLRFKSKAQVKGKNITKVVTKQSLRAKAEAEARAVAKAKVECKEIETPTPPNPPNRPPQVEIDNPQHIFENGEITVCERESDPDGDTLTRQFSITRGNFISGVYAGNDPDEYCRDIKAPSTAGEMSVGVTVRDPQNATASAETTFPVVKDEF